MLRSGQPNPFIDQNGALKRQTSQTDLPDVSSLFTHFAKGFQISIYSQTLHGNFPVFKTFFFEIFVRTRS